MFRNHKSSKLTVSGRMTQRGADMVGILLAVAGIIFATLAGVALVMMAYAYIK